MTAISSYLSELLMLIFPAAVFLQLKVMGGIFLELSLTISSTFK